MRPSKNTDELLKKAARELIIEKATLDIGLRDVAAQAKVNMGMFYYNFKDREEFFLTVLQEYYEEFYGELSDRMDPDEGKNSIEKLKKAILYIGDFVIQNRQVAVAIFTALMSGNEIAKTFFKKNFIRHVRLMVGIIKEGQKSGELIDLPPFTILSMLIAAVNVPTFAYIGFSRGGVNQTKLRLMGATKDTMLSSSALEQRADVILKAFAIKNKGRG